MILQDFHYLLIPIVDYCQLIRPIVVDGILDIDMKMFIILLTLQIPGIVKGRQEIVKIMKGKLKCNKSDMQLKISLLGGQCFRWKKIENDEYRGVIGNRVWTLSQTDEYIEYKVTEITENKHKKKQELETNSAKYDKILSDYLRLDENLEELYSYWSSRDPNFKEVANQFYGVRILRQDPVENVFSFICSSNNFIARISSMVEKLCIFYGEKICELDGQTYYDFPSVSALAEPSVFAKLRQEGFGYRAKYIHESAVKIMSYGGMDWLTKLQKLPYSEAKTELMKLTGIGAKVADCICLMSLNHLEAIPVDTHVFQISQRYLPHLRSKKTVTDKIYNEIGEYFRNLYGNYAGWAHTVLFCADLKMFQKPNLKREIESLSNTTSKEKKLK